MKAFVAATLGFGMLMLAIPIPVRAADLCPAELIEAKAALKNAQASLKKNPQVAKGPDVQAPRSQAGAKSQDIQAPRSEDMQAPRSQDIQAPRVNQAAALVGQADAACKEGDMSFSARKAQEALGLLKK